MSERRITCQTCNGKGRYTPLALLDEQRCETCHGHGFLVAPACPHCEGRGVLEDRAKALP